MTQGETIDDLYVRQRILGCLLTARNPDSAGEVERLFLQDVRPIMAGLGIDAPIIEVYSPGRSSYCKTFNGHRYIVLDHGQLLCLATLDRLTFRGVKMHHVAAAFQRVLAEASRNAQQADLYSFFIRRASEVKSIHGIDQLCEGDEIARTAQTLLILFHEAAHALPNDHELRTATDSYAILKVSSLSTQWLRMLTAKYPLDLGEDLPRITEEDLAEWIVFRDSQNFSDEELGEAINTVANDPSFLGEIACDRTAVSLQQAVLEANREGHTEQEFLQHCTAVFLSLYRTFLHLRLLKYIDDVFLNLPEHITVSRINPLNLHAMVAAGFRGALVGQLILDAAIETGGDVYCTQLRTMLVVIQREHTTQLFEPLNRLLEMTVLNLDFHHKLPQLLAEDGITAVSFGADELDTLCSADTIWLQLA
jgi:hypothetical protein